MNKKVEEIAVFGSGCFWCGDAIFSRLKGVEQVIVGYAGGDMKNPSYEEVCGGSTGHAEVLKVVFDPIVIKYETLLDVFFNTHDPTTMNRQGNDSGTQYRSTIMFSSPEQEKSAKQWIEKLTKAGTFKNPIVTQVVPLGEFYDAESYHQQYAQKNVLNPYCQWVIGPKVDEFKAKFGHLLK